MADHLSAAAHAGHDLLPPWAVLAIYAAGFIITARIAFSCTEAGEDRGEARVAAFGLGVFWPLVAAIWIAAGLVMLPTLGVRTRGDRDLAAREKAAARRQREARIRELEAENEALRRQQEVNGDD